ARALVKSPDIILADEPTGNLDSATSQTIFELLKELSKERLVIVVSHDGESGKKYADTIIECVDGEATLKENNKQDEESVSKKTKLNESPSKSMSARSIAKLGLGFALRHKVRMIVTLILVVLALSFTSVAITMAQSNNVSVEYFNL
ncbi:MAG: ABC transporter permease, partial [Clostridia bacterium]|nr:ABC transporter permease [Clostridia bacterium]